MARARRIAAAAKSKPLLVYGLAFAFGLPLAGVGLPGCAEDEKNKATPSSSNPATSTEPTENTSGSSGVANDEVSNRRRLLRRLTLDLGHRLPSAFERTGIGDQSLKTDRVLDALLTSPQLGLVIAEKHRLPWGLYDSSMPDLEALAASDPSLATRLGQPDARRQLLDAPLMALRYVIDTNKPLSELYQRSWAIAHPAWLSLLGEDTAGGPWPGEDWQLVHYAGSERQGLGPLGDHGVAARYNSHAASDLFARSAMLFQELSCTSLQEKGAHAWTSLTAAEMGQDLRTLALSKQDCNACHALYQSHNSVHQLAHTGADLAAWLSFGSFNAGEPETPIWYGGHPVDTSQGFAKNVAADPRVHFCALNNLVTVLLQNQLSLGAEGRLFASLFTVLREHGMQLRPVIRQLAQAAIYQSTAPEADGKGSSYRESLHVLNHQQWQDLFTGLLSKTPETPFPLELSPGSASIARERQFIPHGPYAHHLRRVARLLAHEIVELELATESLAATRVFFTHLPNASDSAASPEATQSQIIALWELLTAQTITADSAAYTRLRTVWQAGASSGSDQASANRKAWRLVLTAILMSPDFVTY